MRITVIALALLMTSCSKKETVGDTPANDSSFTKENKFDIGRSSKENGVVTADENKNAEAVSPNFRIVEGNKIIKTIKGDMIPLVVQDEFKNADQQFILKIKNLKPSKIVVKVIPSDPQMNIRINQIRLANGAYDGPFSRESTFDIKEEGDFWLMVGKSNMASEPATGKFSVELR